MSKTNNVGGFCCWYWVEKWIDEFYCLCISGGCTSFYSFYSEISLVRQIKYLIVKIFGHFLFSVFQYSIYGVNEGWNFLFECVM